MNVGILDKTYEAKGIKFEYISDAYMNFHETYWKTINLFMVFSPSVLVFAFNIVIISVLVNRRKQQTTLSAVKRSPDFNKTTVVLLTISIAFMICSIPMMVFYFLKYVFFGPEPYSLKLF